MPKRCHRPKTLTFAAAVLALVTAAAAWAAGPVETPRLLVSDRAGTLSQQRLEALALQADDRLVEVLRLWAAKPGIDRHGKIRVAFDRSLGDTRSSVFYWTEEAGRKVRVVQVFGVDGPPLGLAHKLTHAVFPNADKLIRNMMGIYSESLVGDPQSFPMCGHTNDAWTQALLELGELIPVADLGPDHRAWGMEFHNNKPRVRDRARQHAAYAEAGSFGQYLVRTYGPGAMKKFYRLSLDAGRPWRQAFGAALRDLEADWVRSLKAQMEADGRPASVLKRLRKADPDAACDQARRLAPS